MWEGNFDEFGSLGFESLGSPLDTFANLGVNSVGEVFLGESEFHSGDSLIESFGIIGNFGIETGGVAWVDSGDGIEEKSGVFNGVCEWSDLIKR
jgi:hypothetical protein